MNTSAGCKLILVWLWCLPVCEVNSQAGAETAGIEVSQIHIRYLHPLMESPAAVHAKDILEGPLAAPLCEVTLNDLAANRIAKSVLVAANVHDEKSVGKEIIRDTIDTRAVFEFVTVGGNRIQLAYGYPDLFVWLNIRAEAPPKEIAKTLIRLLPQYVSDDIKDETNKK